jgi:hypothetical protein
MEQGTSNTGKLALDAAIWFAVNNWTDAKICGIEIARALRYDTLQFAYHWLITKEEAANGTPSNH